MKRRGPRREILATYFNGSKSTESHWYHTEVLACGHDFDADDKRHNTNATHRYCFQCLAVHTYVDQARAEWNLKHNTHPELRNN